MTRITWAAVVAGVLGWPAAAVGQDRLFVSGGVSAAPYTEEIGAGGDFGAPLGPMSPLVHEPLIGGGRYAVPTVPCAVTPCVVVDWQGVAHPIPYAFASIAATDPVRPRVFVQTASGAIDAVDVESGAVAPMFPASMQLSGACRYAFSVARLFCLEGGPPRSALRVFSTGGEPGEQPQVVGTVAARSFGSYPWLVTPDGSRFFAGAPGAGSERLVLTDVATGARFAADVPSVWSLAWDDYNERLLVLPAPALGHVFTKDLAYLGSAWFPFSATALAVSPATGRLYVRGLVGQSAGFGDAYTTAFDSTTYAPLTPTVHTQGFGGGPRLTVLSPPGAPRDLAAVVTGRDVTLTWTNVGAAAGFLVEVGAAPGDTAVTIPLGWETQARFAAVPPGVYYVRLRGANAFGPGRPSAELRVVVP